MTLKTSDLDPRHNLRLGIYVGAIFGLTGGFRGFVAGAVIGLILAFITAFVVQRTLNRRLEQGIQGENIINYALFLGIITAISGSVVFSRFEPAPLISFLVCLVVALRSGSKIKRTVKDENAEKESKRIKELEAEKQASETIDVKVEVHQPIRTEAENPVKVTVINPSGMPITNISIRAECPRLVRCDEPEVSIDMIHAGSSAYNVIFLYPRIADDVDMGKIYVSYLINGNYYRKGPIEIGVHEAIQEGASVNIKNISSLSSPEISSGLQILRETEFYQGFIRLKMAVNNVSTLVVNDISIEFDFDRDIFRIDRFEPQFSLENDRVTIGNIEGNNSKSIVVYFDPLVCSRSSEIRCNIFYRDAKGKLQNTEMKPKRIEVTCPIMKTDSDINIGILKELLSTLPFRDSKVYQIRSDLDPAGLMRICREMVQKHDIRHVRTLKTRDGKNYESWYYGKTKVNEHDLVLKINISEETGSIELFGATRTAESLVGMLAEFGREMLREMEGDTKNKDIKQIVNVLIKDSIIQRSNLLNSCDLNGNCTDDVVVEDSIIQKSDIPANFCPSCGSKLTPDANFCSECGTRI